MIARKVHTLVLTRFTEQFIQKDPERFQKIEGTHAHLSIRVAYTSYNRTGPVKKHVMSVCTIILVPQHPGPSEAGAAWLHDQAKEHEHNTCFRFWLGPLYSYVLVHHPKTVKQILCSTQPKQSDGIYKILASWGGELDNPSRSVR